MPCVGGGCGGIWVAGGGGEGAPATGPIPGIMPGSAGGILSAGGGPPGAPPIASTGLPQSGQNFSSPSSFPQFLQNAKIITSLVKHAIPSWDSQFSQFWTIQQSRLYFRQEDVLSSEEALPRFAFPVPFDVKTTFAGVDYYTGAPPI